MGKNKNTSSLFKKDEKENNKKENIEDIKDEIEDIQEEIEEIKEKQKKANSYRTSKKVASIASKELRSPKSTKDEKSIAASALINRRKK